MEPDDNQSGDSKLFNPALHGPPWLTSACFLVMGRDQAQSQRRWRDGGAPRSSLTSRIGQNDLSMPLPYDSLFCVDLHGLGPSS
jgi:hypothetical protein